MTQSRLSYGEISGLCLELSLFLHAGTDCGGGLLLLAEETPDSQQKQALLSMAEQLDMGIPLSEAMESSGLVPADVCRMLRIGERTGRLEETLRSLADLYDAREAMDHHLRSALLSPSLLMLVMLTVIVVLLTKVLPIFNEVYVSLGGSLTGLAGGLLRLGTRLNAVLPVLCLLLAVPVGILIAFAGSQRFRNRCTTFVQTAFGNRGRFRQLRTARFAQALSMALRSGMTDEEALDAAALLLSDPPDAEHRCRDCAELLAQGETLPTALQKTELLPAAECRLLALGFASGSGEAAAEEIARRLSRRAEETVERTVSMLEPIMVVVTSLLIGIILLSVMLPLTHIMNVLG